MLLLLVGLFGLTPGTYHLQGSVLLGALLLNGIDLVEHEAHASREGRRFWGLRRRILSLTKGRGGKELYRRNGGSEKMMVFERTRGRERKTSEEEKREWCLCHFWKTEKKI